LKRTGFAPVPNAGGTTDLPYPRDVHHYQERNVIAHSGTDQDEGVDAEGVKIPPVDPRTMAAVIAAAQTHLLKMLSDKGFDYTHPVDEYAPQGIPGPIQSLTIQADYDMPERIETILVVVPVGTTSALLQLGQRSMQLYSGAALVSPLVIAMPVHGLIVNSDDPRILTFTGAVTSQPYLGLTGYALTRGQFS
jgi:hypothetical protein